MKLYVARDKNGNLYLYEELPIRNEEEKQFVPSNNMTEFLKLDSTSFPDVKWEDEPQEVVLVKVK